MAGLLGDLLPYLYSRIDATKRTVGDSLKELATNPKGLLARRDAQLQDMTKPLDGLYSSDPQKQAEGMQAWSDVAPGLLGMTVFHGSPHVFDKFDPAKIGTGEGAQAYGHGLYFAENPAVAEKYRASTGSFDLPDGPAKAAATLISYRGAKGEEMARSILGHSDEVIATAKKAIADKSRLYNVDLPDEQIANMLHWDKPMAEQPANVQAALGMHDPAGFAAQNPAMTGGQAYHELALAMPGGRPAVSDLLHQQGVPGIRYADQGSRGADSGTSNFVVFPQATDLLKILGVQ